MSHIRPLFAACRTDDTVRRHFPARCWSIIQRGVAHLIVCVLLSTTLSSVVWGQITPGQKTLELDMNSGIFGDLLAKVRAMNEKLARDTVHLSPAVATIDAQTKTVSITYTNHSPLDSLRIITVVRYAPPRKPDVDSMVEGILGPDVAVRDSILADSLKQLERERRWSLAHWLKGIPDTLSLASGESRTVTFHLVLPDTLSPGEYSVYLIAKGWSLTPNANAADAPIKPLPVMSFDPDNPMGFLSTSKLVYRHRPTSAPRAR